MPSINVCVIMGNLTKDPSLLCTPSGSPVCEMTIAVNRKSKNRDEACFLDVVSWGKSAENCQKYLAKGSCVLVHGYLKQETWTDRNGGGRRSRLRLVAENVQFISSGAYRADDEPAYAASPGNGSRFGVEDEPDRDPAPHDAAKSNGYQPQLEPPPSGPGEAKPGDDIPF
ncbi:MAG: single-stranded DNA-binding protein [Victivallaceae bacterium]|nr:single-stranded DNA-binding protein [Victivallaceae bacterium]